MNPNSMSELSISNSIMQQATAIDSETEVTRGEPSAANSQQEQTRKKEPPMRNVGLDLLRLIAVLLVIGRHLPVPKGSSEILFTWQRGGWIGVDLFFVLSGFLVSSLLFREHLRLGTVDTKRFLIRRGFKIYPAFWLFLSFTLIVWFFHGKRPHIWQLTGELLFLQNYLGSIWDHTWSLAVEEHFYFGLAALAACLVRFSPKSPFRHIPVIFAIVAITCLAFRLLNLAWYPRYSHRAYLFATHIRIDSLMFGVLISYLSNYHSLEEKLKRVPSEALIAGGMLFLSPAFFFAVEQYRWVSIGGVILFYFGSGLLLLAALRLQSTRSKALEVFAGLGAASYSIYLWHLPVAHWGYGLIRNITGWHNYTLYCVNAIVGAVVIGWILNRLVEYPVLICRDRFFPSKSHGVMPAKIG